MKKYLSRKFIAMLAGVFTGIGVILSGETTQGIVTVSVSVLSYLTAEGYIDSVQVKTAAELADKLGSAALQIKDRAEKQ